MNIIVMPATLYQVKLIKKLQELNHKVIVVNPECTPATQEADVFIKEDIFKTEDVANKINIKIDRVISDQSDIAIYACYELAKKIDADFHLDLKDIELYSSNKYNMYRHAQEKKINHLPVEKIKSPSDVSLDFPIVLKPSDGTNSRGVIGVDSKKELSEKIDLAKSFTKKDFVIAQKYLNPEVQIIVDGIVIDGKYHSLAFSEKGPYWHLAITSHIEWPLQNEKIKERIHREIQKFVGSTTVKNCLIHAEFMINENVIYLNEIACRGGGFYLSSHIAPHVSSIDTYDFWLSSCLNNEHKTIPTITNKAAILKFYKSAIGQKQTKGLLISESKFNQREFVKNKTNPRTSFAIIVANTPTELKERIADFEKHNVHND